MSRSGVEAKIPWTKVPKQVRQQVEAVVDSPVRRAARVWGGYGPAPTFRLAFADGQRAFFKATYKESNEFSTRALREEVRVYQELGELLTEWAPKYYATIAVDDWHGLLLEDLGPKSVPPWTIPLTRHIARGLASFHRSTLGLELPAWLSRPQDSVIDEKWPQVTKGGAEFQQLAAFAGDAAQEAQSWLHMVSPLVNEQMQHPILLAEPYSLLHGDLRSDNLRYWRGRLSLFDWPAITVGRPEWDMVVFAQSVTVEGGPLPEEIMAWYSEEIAVDTHAINASIAWWFCFFANRAWREEIPGLPRVRRFQRQQVAVLAQWMARQWALSEPTWVQPLLAPLNT